MGSLSEKNIEKYLVDKVSEMGGLCWKFVSPSQIGVPDRIVIIKGLVVFVEVKAPGKEPRASQRFVKELINRQGLEVWTVSTIEEVDEFISELKSDLAFESKR